MTIRQHLPALGVTLFSLVVCLAILGLPPVVIAQANNQTHQVLVLYWDNKDFPGNIKFDDAFQSALHSSRLTNVEYYPEYFEATRFPGENHALSFRDYLREKYAGRKIDAVVASADTVLNFLLTYRADLFPNSPVVFVTTRLPNAETLKAGPGATGIIHQSTYRQTVNLALTLHPDTRHLFVISGSLDHDRRFEKVAQQELSGFEGRVEINYLTDLSLNELINRTASLPPKSIALYVWQQAVNEQGKRLETFEVLARISPKSSAPIYGMGAGNLGQGIVGGYLQGPERNGAKAAELVERILNGARARDVPVEPAPDMPMFDWRQLRRWGISQNRLPPGSVVEFREFTFWELYKWRILGVIAVFLLQTLIIGFLLVERQRRRRAKEALNQLNAELEERIVARTAALDAKTRELETFAYSVAHDLKAPLRGIDGYTRLLLEDHWEQLNEEGRTFLNTIHTSSGEMNQLIEDLLDYSRLERRELNPDRIELKRFVDSLVAQKEPEIAGRQLDLVVSVNGGSVMADRNGLTQALNNYLDNALKFTRDAAPARIEIGSEETPVGWLLWVRDNGAGFDMKYHDRIFQIFQRLQRSEDYPGTGVGLAIVRKAMERMGGKAWALSQPGAGATFYLELPK